MLHFGPGMTRASQTLSGFSIILALASGGVAARHAAATRESALELTAAQAQVRFNRDIAPIVFQNCAQCHHPGEAGPFPRLTYENVKAHARQIAVVTSKRIM